MGIGSNRAPTRNVPTVYPTALFGGIVDRRSADVRVRTSTRRRWGGVAWIKQYTVGAGSRYRVFWHDLGGKTHGKVFKRERDAQRLRR
jgi:hypothetical protein